MNLLTNLFNQILYIDPAATSVLLSSITAIVLAIGASAIIIWRKLKKNVQKTFKIDPNSGKEREEDLVINDTSSEEVAVSSDQPKETPEVKAEDDKKDE